MNSSEVLDKAADAIERDGWNQNGYAPDQSEDGTPLAGLPVCATGAIYIAAEVPVKWSGFLGCWIGFCAFSEAAHVADVLERYLEVSGSASIPHWNDAKDRAATEVVEALRAAAVIEAARETATPAMDGKAATKAESADEGAVTV